MRVKRGGARGRKWEGKTQPAHARSGPHQQRRARIVRGGVVGRVKRLYDGVEVHARAGRGLLRAGRGPGGGGRIQGKVSGQGLLLFFKGARRYTRSVLRTFWARARGRRRPLRGP